MKLLKKLCKISAVSGEEYKIRDFIISHIQSNISPKKREIKLLWGVEFLDSLIVIIGKPKVAVFAHMDSVGFIVRNVNELVKVGTPVYKRGDKLITNNDNPLNEYLLEINNVSGQLSYVSNQKIEVGTTLTYKPIFKNANRFIQCCSLDNRVGVWNCLKLIEDVDNGLFAFTCWEELHGGSVEFLTKYIYENFKINQFLISDVTKTTDIVLNGKGVVISLKDSNMPRKFFKDKIINIAQKHQICYQLEIEEYGGSDGSHLQKTPYPIDWCFLGIACNNIHSSNEVINIDDILELKKFYFRLLEEL